MNKIIRSKSEEIWIYSMGKRFQLMAIATTNDAANEYCEKHDSAAVIACFGPLIFIANKYAGVKEAISA